MKCMDFNELNQKDFYDGVWACSSILHVKRSELLEILVKIRDALKIDGYFYTSFSNGSDQEEYKADGRYFNDLTKDSFTTYSTDAGLEIVEYSSNKSKVAAHNAPDHKEVIWNSYILRRKN